ncbi:hypothetical protein D9V37_07145 [Nocardioides mangrovicus]|uniref:Sulfotransferase family protein n=1 Tax=Nocardioides mangrovicus TaxID=2478913 RepID=A0A3L8P2Z7_9ACTN|nr:hypothetical protein D9V37_07145 [Nocardioides mangrovicus]
MDDSPVAVLVVGMHRSGTSALTRLVSILDVALPQSMLPAAEDNPLGFFEPSDLVELDERILQTFGLGWADIEPLQDPAAKVRAHPELVREVARVIDAEFGPAPHIVIKDPRLARVLPFVVPALDLHGRRTVALLPYRDAWEVAGSLAARDGMTRSHATALWLRYLLDAELNTRGLPRAFCRFDELLDAPVETASRLVEQTALLAPAAVTSRADCIEAVIAADQRHHQRRPGQAGLAQEWLNDLLAAFDRLAVDGYDAEALARIDEIRAAFDAGAPLLSAAQHEHAAATEELRTEFAARKALSEAERVTLAAQLEHAVAERDDARSRLRNTRGLLRQARQQLRTTRVQIRRTRRELQEATEALQRRPSHRLRRLAVEAARRARLRARRR